MLLSVLAAGLLSFCGVVVETAMNVAFPTLMEEFGITTSSVQWITTGYLLVLAIIVPTSSFLNKRFPLKKLFLASVILFIVGTLMGALAPSFAILLTGRLIQGIGTGIALPLMYNIILQQTPYDKMGVMMGAAIMITGVAPALGPSLGGLMVTNYGWRAIFIVLLPCLIFSLIAGALAIRQSFELSRPSFDLQGYLMLAICFASLIIGCSMAGTYGWISVQTLVLLALVVILILLFLRREKRTRHPLINTAVFANRQFSASLGAFSIIFFTILSISFLLPNFAQLSLGSTALNAGLILLPGSILSCAISLVSGRLYDKIGPRVPLTVGIVVVLISQILFALTIQNAAVSVLTGIYIAFAFGQGLIVGNSMTHGLKSLPDNLNADGNAVFNTMQQLFGAIGTSIISSVVSASQANTSMKTGTTTGTFHGFMLLTVLSVLCMICIAIALRYTKSQRRTKAHKTSTAER